MLKSIGETKLKMKSKIFKKEFSLIIFKLVYRWDFHKNMINLNGQMQLNVPKEFWPIWKYRATLGHKINHSFIHDNSKFGFGHHPRFGFIRTIVATKDIQAGQELWVNYGYNVKNPNVPQWYRDTYIREVGPIK